MTKNYYWKNIERYCDYFVTEDNSVLEIDSIDSEKLTDALSKNETFDVIKIIFAVGKTFDLQTFLQKLHLLCHSQTRVMIVYYNPLWEPLIRFAEWIRIKRKTGITNWLSGNDLKNFLYLADYDVFRKNKSLLIPWNIPVISWLFNRYISRLPLISSLSLNQYIFARPQSHLFERKAYSTTVVIPARNESGNIENAILRLPKFGKHVEIIFVEGNSTDDTWDKIQEIQQKYASTHDIKIAKQDGKGKADAVRKGYDMATGDILMILDADLTVPPEDIPKFYEAIASGKGEFINGSRLVYPMESKAMRTLNMIGNKFFSLVFSWMLEQPIKDTLCGTKVMFRKDYVRLQNNRKFFGDFDPFGDFDLLFGAYKLNLKIVDLPIRYCDRTYGDTNISRFKHGVILLRMCVYAANKIKFW